MRLQRTMRLQCLAFSVSPRMNTIASRDQFKPIRIGENLVVNYKTRQKHTTVAPAVDVMMARTKRIYILIMKVNKLFFFSSSRCFPKEIENMFSVTVFLSSYTNTSGSLREREMLWEHEPQASVSTAFSSSPKLSRSTCFLFLLENNTTRKRKIAC